MTPERWEQVRELFLQALDRPVEDRAQFVVDQADKDTELAASVQRLLLSEQAMRERTHEFLEPPSSELFADQGPSPKRLVGSRLGDLEILEELGSGAMGVVYRARQASLDRVVAVKVLRSPLSFSAAAFSSFRAEPGKTASFQHANIVTIYWFGEEDGLPYFVMEYVPGQSLAALLRRGSPGAEGLSFDPGSPSWIATTVAQVADALEYSHRHGIVHRDVKPGNVLIDKEGSPHLVDFGIAKDLSSEMLSSKIVGTPHYMSPEQARIKSVEVDHRTDVYSLGVVLYEMLTRQRPFEGVTFSDVFLAIRDHDPPPVRKLNPRIHVDLETICGKAMRKEVDRRYITASELAADLRRFLGREPILARPQSVLSKWHSKLKRRPVLTVTSVSLLLCLPSVWWIAHASANASARRRAVANLPSEQQITELQVSWEHPRDSLQQLGRWHQEIEALQPQDKAPEERWSAARQALQDRAEAIAGQASRSIGEILQVAAADPSGGDLPRLSELMAMVRQVAAWLPDSQTAEFDSLLSGIMPRLSVRSDPPGGYVTLYRVDPYSGLPVVGLPAVDAGVANGEAFSVPPGYYRVEAVRDAQHYGETFVLVSHYGTRYEVPPLSLRDVNTVTQEMVLIGPGVYQAGGEEHRDHPFPIPRGPQELSGFWVDRYEVTNREYRDFCLATGHPFPEEWPADAAQQWDPDWDELPVVWVDVYDASAFAAWAGKRLLTHLEWDRAARGQEGWEFPWSAREYSAEEVRALANVRPQDPPQGGRVTGETEEETQRREWQEYLRHVVAVGKTPDRTPEGVHDVMGNVGEWSAAMAIHQVRDEVWLPAPGTRWVKGTCWAWIARSLTFHSPVAAQSNSHYIGFRCGKSQRRR